MVCFKCGATKDKAILFDVISPEGIVQICNSCYKHENLPLIEKHDFSERKPDTAQSVHDRLVKASGIDNIRQKTFEENKEILKKNLELKQVVDSNYRKILRDVKPRDDLIENFHWIIMRTRRKKHLTQSQFAVVLGEPEIAIKTLEQGIVAENGDALIKKVEKFLDINLFKREKLKFENEEELPIEIDEFSIDNMKNENYTVGDINNISKEKNKKSFWKSLWSKKDEDETKNIDELEVEPSISRGSAELSDEEIDEILFGK